MANWGRVGKEWFELGSLPSRGPVLLTDKTQTIQWFAKKPSNAAIDHQEHKRDDNGFVFDDQDKPIIETRKVKPAFWSPVEVVG